METLLKVFDKYGWPGVIVILLVGVIWLLLKTQTKHVNTGLKEATDKMTNTIVEQNGELVKMLGDQNDKMIGCFTDTLAKQNDKLVDCVITLKGSQEAHDMGIDERLDVQSTINDKIKHLCDILHAQRVAVLEFHNSKENLDGLPFVWYDMQYEYQVRNIEAIENKVKNLQAGALSPVIDELKNNDYILWLREDIDNVYDKSSVLYDYLINKLNLNAIIYYPLYNNLNKLIGLLAVEYGESFNTELINDIIDINEIKLEAGAISTLITLMGPINN